MGKIFDRSLSDLKILLSQHVDIIRFIFYGRCLRKIFNYGKAIRCNAGKAKVRQIPIAFTLFVIPESSCRGSIEQTMSLIDVCSTPA